MKGYVCDKMKLVIVGNKIDLDEKYSRIGFIRREVTSEEGLKLA